MKEQDNEEINNTSVQKDKKKTATKSVAKSSAGATTATTSAKRQAFMYLGPNIPGGILFTGAVYKELPEHLNFLFEKIPEIEELFIEIKNVPAFKAELTHQGSEAFRLRQNVETLIREGALKNGV